jgi:3-oxoadipate enol-lactonase
MKTSGFESFVNHDISTCLGRIRVRIGGQANGPVIAFWSSLLMNSEMWSSQAQYFADRFRILLIDPPGHGKSEPLTRKFTFKECATCVAQLLDALNIDKTHFVGNSWGGMIGGTFAALFPDRVGVSVLMNCTASAVGIWQKIEYFFFANLLRAIGRIPASLDSLALNAFIGPTTTKQRPEVINNIRRALATVNGSSIHWAVRSVVLNRPDQHTLVAGIRTPVLVLAGSEDRTFPVPETKAMADSIPGAEFKVLSGAAHLVALECPHEVNSIIDKALKSF